MQRCRLPAWLVSLKRIAVVGSLGLACSLTAASSFAKDAMDWPNWRGPEQNRVSRETGLIDHFDLDTKENVLWRVPEAAGISSPIVMNGKVYTQVRYKPDTKEEQEEVICLNADTGKILWENRWNVYLSDVPAERVGWSSVCGDPDTGYVYSLGVNGNMSCINGETGKTIWTRSLGEEFGMISPYGGRTHPPSLFEDLVIINAVMTGWGDTSLPAQRILALDKKTGETRWFSHTKERPEDTVFGTPTYVAIDGQMQMIMGGADGAVWGFQPRTGKPLWNFRMSRRGISATPFVLGDKVFATQNEENLDNHTQGSLTCFTVGGSGDISKTNEVWHLYGDQAGKSSPLVVGDRVYSADDQGNLYVADIKTGKLIGNKPIKLIGTIVRASPLYADGKIYLCSLTAWHVMEPTENGVKFISKKRFPERDEVSGSLAVSHGKIYLPTGEALYCLGKKDAKPAATPIPAAAKENAIEKSANPTQLLVTPGEVLLKPGKTQQFTVRFYDNRGRAIESGTDELKKHVEFDVKGAGSIDKNGLYTAPGGSAPTVATVSATLGEAKGETRIRIIPPLPWKFDFNDTKLTTDPNNPNAPPSGEPPVTWIGARYRHKIIEKDGDKVMVKITTIPKGTRSQSWMGPDDMHDYTVQADMQGQFKPSTMAASTSAATSGSKASDSDAPSAQALNPSSAENPVNGLPDMGLIAQRYTLDLMGNSQQLQIRSWPPQVARRFSKTIPFPWQGDKWYTMKFSAGTTGGKAVLKGKVWPRGEKEPDKWTIEAVDDVPNLQANEIGKNTPSPSRRGPG
jgi:outer membrane protein assembly factor BamB